MFPVHSCSPSFRRPHTHTLTQHHSSLIAPREKQRLGRRFCVQPACVCGVWFAKFRRSRNARSQHNLNIGPSKFLGRSHEDQVTCVRRHVRRRPPSVWLPAALDRGPNRLTLFAFRFDFGCLSGNDTDCMSNQTICIDGGWECLPAYLRIFDSNSRVSADADLYYLDTFRYRICSRSIIVPQCRNIDEVIWYFCVQINRNLH